uniref:Regulator of G protein signaling 9 binding protein n=1 Tax=Eptatretus burgeri TaxID=7764 RepID=A0A8C4PVV4_EPTBU
MPGGVMAACEECRALVQALNKVTACFRQLVMSIGGSSDSLNLREELRRTRRRARELVGTIRGRLTSALRDGGALMRERRADFERLWVAFASCLEQLEADMRRALELARIFPLNMPRRALVQTGMSGGTSGLAARALSTHSLRHCDASEHSEETDLLALQKDLIEVGETIAEMENKVNVPRWSIVAIEEPGAELRSTAIGGGTSAGMLNVDARRRRTCRLSRRLAALLFTMIILLAVVLSVCVAKFA